MFFKVTQRYSLMVIGALICGACTNPHHVEGGAYLNKVMKPLSWFNRAPKDQIANEQSIQLNATYYYLLGQELSAAGKSDEAIVAYERVRTLDPASAHVHLALAQEYLKKGLSQEGVAMVRKAIELDPQDHDARLLLATLYQTAKKYPEAEELLAKLAAENPDDEEVVLNLALLELEQKDFAGALKRLNGYLDRDPESALAYFYIGRLQQEQGHKAEALKAYAKAIDLRSGFVQAGTYMGFLQEEMGDRKGALETFEWLAEQTDGARYHKKLGQLYLEANDYAKALLSFENYERVEPTDLNNKVKIGLLLIETKHPAEAEKKFKEILKESPDSENVRFYLGAVFEEMKKPDDALREYAKLPASSKLYSEALKKQAIIYQTQNRFSDGWKLIDKAINASEKDDARFEELVDLGSSYLSNAKHDQEASALLDRALKKLPDSQRLLYAKGVLLEKEDQTDAAVAIMKKIIERDPDHAAALNFVGFLWADRNEHLAESEAMIRKALKTRPQDPFIMDSLGWVLYRQGRLDASLKVLREAQALSPDESVIAEHVADVLVKLGRLVEAKSHYEKALELGPEKDSDKKDIEAKIQRTTKDIQSHCRRGGAHCTAADDGVREPRAPASTPQN